MNQTSNEPDLVSDEDLRWWAIDEELDDDSFNVPQLMAAELLAAREVLTLLVAGGLSVGPFGGGVLVWRRPLADVRPDLAQYLDALPKEDSQ